MNKCREIYTAIIMACALLPAEAADHIPVGSYAISEEVCKLDSSETDSLADFRSRFGSAALLDVSETEFDFAAIPAYCQIARTKDTGSALQVQAECSVSGNTEDVLFSIDSNPPQLGFSVIKGPKDGWFSKEFKRTYILCKK
jgi:hypothetical protein